MKNIFRKTCKITIVIGLTVFFGLNTFLPIFKVNAEPEQSYGSGDNCINADVIINEGQEALFSIESVTVDGYALTNDKQFCVSGPSHTFVITVNKLADKIPSVGWGGNWNNNASVTNTSIDGDTYVFTVIVTFFIN